MMMMMTMMMMMMMMMVLDENRNKLVSKNSDLDKPKINFG